jgi:catechol 2,3-dioxygenase-like lactoylglutathione lyase family enzyme
MDCKCFSRMKGWLSPCEVNDAGDTGLSSNDSGVPMLSHVYIGISDFEQSYRFYAALMAPLGHQLRFRDDERAWAGWQAADGGRPLLLIGAPYEGEFSCGNGQMVALLAPSRAAVDQAYAAALSEGGRCEGAPGLRPHYHANYYGAYFRDQDGNKLAVCCHEAE